MRLKINPNSVILLYTNNEYSEKEIAFIIESNTIQYLGINLPKEVKELYSEICQTLI